MSDLITIGDTAAYHVKDTNADRFYLFRWTSVPSMDQETANLVSHGVFYDNLNLCQYIIYYIMETPIKVRVQYFLATMIVVYQIIDVTEFPRNTQNKQK